MNGHIQARYGEIEKMKAAKLKEEDLQHYQLTVKRLQTLRVGSCRCSCCLSLSFALLLAARSRRLSCSRGRSMARASSSATPPQRRRSLASGEQPICVH